MRIKRDNRTIGKMVSVVLCAVFVFDTVVWADIEYHTLAHESFIGELTEKLGPAGEADLRRGLDIASCEWSANRVICAYLKESEKENPSYDALRPLMGTQFLERCKLGGGERTFMLKHGDYRAPINLYRLLPKELCHNSEREVLISFSLDNELGLVMTYDFPDIRCQATYIFYKSGGRRKPGSRRVFGKNYRDHGRKVSTYKVYSGRYETLPKSTSEMLPKDKSALSSELECKPEELLAILNNCATEKTDHPDRELSPELIQDIETFGKYYLTVGEKGKKEISNPRSSNKPNIVLSIEPNAECILMLEYSKDKKEVHVIVRNRRTGRQRKYGLERYIEACAAGKGTTKNLNIIEESWTDEELVDDVVSDKALAAKKTVEQREMRKEYGSICVEWAKLLNEIDAMRKSGRAFVLFNSEILYPKDAVSVPEAEALRDRITTLRQRIESLPHAIELDCGEKQTAIYISIDDRDNKLLFQKYQDKFSGKYLVKFSWDKDLGIIIRLYQENTAIVWTTLGFIKYRADFRCNNLFPVYVGIEAAGRDVLSDSRDRRLVSIWDYVSQGDYFLPSDTQLPAKDRRGKRYLELLRMSTGQKYAEIPKEQCVVELKKRAGAINYLASPKNTPKALNRNICDGGNRALLYSCWLHGIKLPKERDFRGVDHGRFALILSHISKGGRITEDEAKQLYALVRNENDNRQRDILFEKMMVFIREILEETQTYRYAGPGSYGDELYEELFQHSCLAVFEDISEWDETKYPEILDYIRKLVKKSIKHARADIIRGTTHDKKMLSLNLPAFKRGHETRLDVLHSDDGEVYRMHIGGSGPYEEEILGIGV